MIDRGVGGPPVRPLPYNKRPTVCKIKDMATTFQRARSDEQRAARSQAILDTAAAMLEEMPVAGISLNELSRRVGLAKSNVLRYFDSREAVLLELLASSVHEWLAHLAAELPSAVRRRAAFKRRAGQVAAAVARSLVERPVLCDLMSAQAAVLEHNVTVETVTRYKLAVLADAEALAGLIHDALPELSQDDAWRYIVGAWLMTSALWTHARPPDAVLQAWAADDRLEKMHLDFPAMLEDYLTTLAIGLHARAAG
jgi:AcrR family transcriptional regulator